MANTALEISHVSKYYDGIPVLDDVSFALEQKEILVVIGQNASAKSTLIKILSGLVRPDGGEVLINGKPVVVKSPHHARKLGIMTLYEDVVLPDNLTVAEYLFLGSYAKISAHGRIGMLNLSEMYRMAQKLTKEYNFNVDVHRKISTLDTSRRQMLPLLRAITQNTKLLLIDNCLGLLDEQDLHEALIILKKLRDSGISILITTQKYYQMFDITSSAIVIQNNHFSEKIKSQEGMDELIKKLSIADNIAAYPKLDVKKGKVFFECRNICYGDKIQNVSFGVAQGEVIGVVGGPGSGRTLLAKVLCGDLRMDIGKIYMDGAEVKLRNPADAKKKGIMMVADNNSGFGLVPQMNLASNIGMSNYDKVSLMRFLISDRKLRAATLDVAKRLSIKYSSTQQRAEFLSSGNKQKLSLARAIFSNTRLFLLSEPTIGIDTAGSIQIYNIVNELAREGKAVIFFTSDIQEAVGMCDRIFVMRKGKVVGEFSRRDFTKNTFDRKCLD